MIEYIKVRPNSKKITHLRIEFVYSLGGYDCWNHKNEKRGYYLSVSPVSRNGYFESYSAFSGCKKLIKSVSRQSRKAKSEAEMIMESEKSGLIDYICKKENLQIE